MMAVPKWATVAVELFGSDEIILFKSGERRSAYLLNDKPDEIIFGIEKSFDRIWEWALLILEVETLSFRIWVVLFPEPCKQTIKGWDGVKISTESLKPGELRIAIDGNLFSLNEAAWAATSPRPVLYSTSAVWEALWADEIELDIDKQAERAEAPDIPKPKPTGKSLSNVMTTSDGSSKIKETALFVTGSSISIFLLRILILVESAGVIV